MRKIWTLLLAAILLTAVVGFANAEFNGGVPEEIQQSARKFFEEPWMPQGMTLVCARGEDLWRIEAYDSEGAEPDAVLELDAEYAEFAVTFHRAGTTLPPLRIDPDTLPGQETTGWARRGAATLLFKRLRADVESAAAEARCLQDLGDECWLYGLEAYGELDAVLVLRISERENGIPQLMAYADLDFNWAGRYDGCISIGEAIDAAQAAVAVRYDPEGALALADHLTIEDIALIVWDAESVSEQETPPEAPFWIVTMLDQRADPQEQRYDSSLEFYRYHVLVDPQTGEVLEQREPEEYSAG